MTKRGLAKGASVLVLGTAGGQALIILSSPLLTRLYSADEFGVFGVYIAVVSLMGLIASGRYELAIPLPEGESNARSLVVLAYIVAIAVTLVLFAFLLVWGGRIARLLNVPVSTGFVWLIPVSVLLIAVHKVTMYWLIRHKNLKSLSIARLSQGAAAATTQVVLGFMQTSWMGLILGHLVGIAVGFLAMLKGSRSTPVELHSEKLVSKVSDVARRYRRFPMLSIWADFANVLGTQLPVVLFAGLFSPSIAGLYMLAHRVANAPTALVAEAIGKAYMASAVSASRDSALPSLAAETFRLLMQSGILPVIIIAAVSPSLFAFVFGPDWREAGHFLRLISPWIAMVFVFAPQTVLYAVLEKQEFEFAFQATLLVVRLGALTAGASISGPEMSIGLFAAGSALTYLVYGVTLLHLAGVSIAATVRLIVTEISIVAVYAAVLFACLWSVSSDAVSILIAVGFGIVAVFRIRPALRRLAAHS